MTGRILLGICGISLAACAWSDDGILYYYGAPKLMHGESRIRMVSEVVTARVFRDHSEVHCRFVFLNDGGATTIRIGFPDGDSNFEDWEKPRPELKNFRSRVDGKSIALRIEESDKSPNLYHSKTVRFGKGQTHVIEDWYRAELSGGETRSMVPSSHGGQENLWMSLFTYVMASGGSWHGNIGDATLIVEFMEKHLRKLRLVDERAFGDPRETTKLGTLALNRVLWAGFAKPHAIGNRVICERQNFKPTEKDDISLTFDWLKYANKHYDDGDK